MQPIIDALSGMMRSPSSSSAPTHHKRHKHGCGCGCHEHDCGCSCCIRCADVVEYALCGEVRRIPITFDNDTRRERDVTLQLGNFTTESGQDVGWQASLSTSTFKLPPCGETTVLLSVNVDCSKLGIPSTQGDAANAYDRRRLQSRLRDSPCRRLHRAPARNRRGCVTGALRCTPRRLRLWLCCN